MREQPQNTRVIAGAFTAAALAAGVSAVQQKLREHWEAIWQELQRNLAALSPQSPHVHSETASRHIQLDDLALVVEEIRRMHAAIRDELRV